MIIGLMQPYFLPYIGYFQLMRAVDIYVYYDDVTFIKQGWINRNNITLDGHPYRFTLELKGASSYKKINEIEVGGNREKLYKTMVQAYSKAPYYRDAIPLLHGIFHSTETNLFKYILDTHQQIFHYLRMDIATIASSKVNKDCSLKGKDKVLSICKALEATTYVNAIGGKELYSKEEFMQNGITLVFLHTSEELSKRSIIDIIMNHSIEEIREMFKNYRYE